LVGHSGPFGAQLWGYWYMVDGVKALDPGNGETQRDGSRTDNLLMISGPESDLWDFKDVPHGTIQAVWYPSPILKQGRRRMYVYTPSGYETGRDRYPPTTIRAYSPTLVCSVPGRMWLTKLSRRNWKASKQE
jgi:hypothetical protein